MKLPSDPLPEHLLELLADQDPGRALAALHRPRKDLRDLAAMLSGGADEILEEMAVSARMSSLKHFGRTVQLYIPIYLSNRCVGGCPYCGFKAVERIQRGTLTMEQITDQTQAVARMGMRHVLLVSGDTPKDVDVGYLCDAVARIKKLMPSVSIEVAPLAEEDYRRLARAGLDGVTLYQETYDREAYTALHAKGPKKDYDWRMGTLDRAGAAGIRTLTAGALWGLASWREEAIRLGLHLRDLTKRWWRSQIQVGLPRLRRVPSDFKIPCHVTDRDLTHLVVALRNYIHELGIVLSTRETPTFRDGLFPLGVTQMSAGSSTSPGGYTDEVELGGQFEVVDERSPEDVALMLKERGYDPVWKDWDSAFGEGERSC